MEYWKECIAEALEDSGIKATDEQIDNITSWVEGAHENYSMATGEECIPHPLLTEVDGLKKIITKQKDQHEHQLHGICKGVAQRRNTSVNDVCIDDDGHVTYR